MWVSERCHCYACASIGNRYCGDTGPLQFEQIPVKHQHWIINKLPNMLTARNRQVQLGRGAQRGAQRLWRAQFLSYQADRAFTPDERSIFCQVGQKTWLICSPRGLDLPPTPTATCGSSAGDQQGSQSSRTCCAQTSLVWLDIKSMIKK